MQTESRLPEPNLNSADEKKYKAEHFLAAAQWFKQAFAENFSIAFY